MRIGVFGGTFDPVHLGHLIVAEQCREQAGLDQVLFVPAARPPHKPEGATAAFARRVEMLELALAGQPAFRVEELERDRPGPSYTADTLEELHARQTGSEVFLILGADCLPDLPNWYQPERIVRLATLLVVNRIGSPGWSEEELSNILRMAPQSPLKLQTVNSPLIEISSSDVRSRARDQRSLRYLVPRAVECYIENQNLYRNVELGT
jgi:nicotinate-nucleotide adenylyltransferase